MVCTLGGEGVGGQIDIDPIYKFDKPTGRNKEQFTHIIKSTNSNL